LERLDAVARREVLERHVRRARVRGGAVAAVDDDEVPVEAAQVDVRRGDEDAGLVGPLLVVDAGPHQHPVLGPGPSDRLRDGRERRMTPPLPGAPTARAGSAALPLAFFAPAPYGASITRDP